MATTRNQVSYGSQGSDVTELQKLLNKNGYSLDEDGIFGAKTQQAVKDYQQKNNLAVDGIVGTNTWGALTGASSAGGTAATTPTSPTFKYDAYQESDVVKQAQAMLQQQMAQKPGAYQSQWQTQLNDTINKILNREKFSYDLNGDALWKQYKDQYTTQGKMAMMDTMGQAQAMTGGYGNSYAQSVGQQAYQGHLQQLNDRIPELYQLALNKYQMEGDEMAQQMAILAQQEEQDYGRYRDQLGDWQTETDRLQDRYDAERDFDYGKWADGRDFAYGQYADDRNFQYQQDRDKIADEQWQKEFDEAVRQYNHKNGIGTSTGSSSNPTANPNPSPSPAPTGYDNGGLSTAGVMAIQQALGVKADGKWGPATAAAAQKKWGVSTADAAYQKYTGGQDKDGDGYKDSYQSGFTGSTYSEAVAYLKSQGVDGASAAGIMTASEFKRSTSSRQFTSYEEYLQYTCDKKIATK